MRRLKLPETVGTPTFDEVPKQEMWASIENSKNALIVEGYLSYDVTSEDALYKFYAEINIDYDKIWNLIETLVSQMPDKIALIFHLIDEEPKYGYYADKYELLNFLKPYVFELINDPYLEFGFIHQNTEGSYCEEVFLKAYKYLQYWGMDKGQFVGIMNQFDLFPVENMEFIDSYPVRRSVLKGLYPDVIDTKDLISILEEKYGNNQVI